MPHKNAPASHLTAGMSLAAASLALAAIFFGLWWGMRRNAPKVESAAPFGQGPAQMASRAGILTALAGEPAPGWTLLGQNGTKVSLSQFRGRAVIFMPVDPACTSVCPVVASEMRQADRILGGPSRHVAIVGFNVNPYWTSVAAIRKFDRENHLTSLPNWYFVTGSAKSLISLWQHYHIWVEPLPAKRAVYHASYLYFIGPHGRERWLLGGSSDKSLASSYSVLAAEIVRSLLERG